MRKQVFTLLELLMVIAVIAMLASLLLPSLMRAKKATYEIVCKGNLRTCGNAWIMYVGDNNERLPLYAAYGNATWPHNLHDYMPTACPRYGLPRSSYNDARLVTRCHLMSKTWDYWYPDWGQACLSFYYDRLATMPYAKALSINSSGSPRKIENYAMLRDFSATIGSVYYGDMLHSGAHNVLFMDWHVEKKKGVCGSAYESYSHYYY